MPVDKGVPVGARELVLVGQRRAAEPAGLDPGAGEMTGGDVVIVRAVVDQRLPVDRLEPFRLGLTGDVLERAVVAVGPAVIGAHEALGAAVVNAAHTVAAVGTC